MNTLIELPSAPGEQILLITGYDANRHLKTNVINATGVIGADLATAPLISSDYSALALSGLSGCGCVAQSLQSPDRVVCLTDSQQVLDIDLKSGF